MLKKQAWTARAAAFMSKEPFLLITLMLTAVCSLLSRPDIASVHWSVIATLFSLMLVCLAFEQCSLLTALSRRAIGIFNTPGKLGLAMILVTGLLSMLITNDVALLTVVPLTMMMANLSGEDPYMLIVLETMSANIFSALTPFGNPQNLYLYTYFHIPAGKFFMMMLPFGLLGAVLLGFIDLVFNRGHVYKIEAATLKIHDKKLLMGAFAAFILNILSVLRFLDYRIALIFTLLLFLILAPHLLTKVDYGLLLTFVLFFLFTDSVTGIPVITEIFTRVLSTDSDVLLVSAGVSQVISNVPAAVLLSGFTGSYKNLLYGVSAGGLGTLIASLASLISYKFYVRKYRAGRYLKVFTIMNFSVLLIMITAIMLAESLV